VVICYPVSQPRASTKRRCQPAAFLFRQAGVELEIRVSLYMPSEPVAQTPGNFSDIIADANKTALGVLRSLLLAAPFTRICRDCFAQKTLSPPLSPVWLAIIWQCCWRYGCCWRGIDAALRDRTPPLEKSNQMERVA